MALRSKPFWSATGALAVAPVSVALPPDWTSLKIKTSVQALARTGRPYTPAAVATVPGVITIRSSGSPGSGTWQARIRPLNSDLIALTAAIPYNETAANIKTAFINTGMFATGDIVAAGGALPTDVTLTLQGVYTGVVPSIDVNYAGLNQGRIDALLTTAPLGNGGYGYIEAGTQDYWEENPNSDSFVRFLYLAAVTGTGTYWVTAYN